MPIEILLRKLGKPAQRAIQAARIATLEQLAGFNERELLALHGIGKNALAAIKTVLQEHGLCLKNPS